MAAGNLSAGLMDPKTRALYANLLRRPNVTITQNTAAAQRPSNIAGMRIQDQQQQMAQNRDALNTVDPGFGYYAPLAGVIKGIASNISRGQQEKTLDELYGQYAAAQQAERAQAAQAAEAARLQKLADEQAAREAEGVITRQNEAAKQAAITARERSLAADERANQPAFDADLEGKLRGELEKTTKDFGSINDAFGRVSASREAPSAAGDMALIFNYMKRLDPGSTVREGEFAAAQQSGGWDDRIESARQQVISGKRLSDAQRKDFGERSLRLYNEALGNYDKRVAGFENLVSQYDKARPEAVIRDSALYRGYELPAAQPAPTEAPPAALQYLEDNPDTLPQFIEQFGYNPMENRGG